MYTSNVFVFNNKPMSRHGKMKLLIIILRYPTWYTQLHQVSPPHHVGAVPAPPSSDGLKWRGNLFEVTPSRLEFLFFIFFISHPPTGRSWTATLSHFLHPSLLSPFSRLLILLLSTLIPALPVFTQQSQNPYAPSAPMRLGKPPFSVAAARDESTPLL